MAIWVDLNSDYTQKPGNLEIEDTDVINASIHRILTTTRRSRFFNRGFGSDLNKLLFRVNVKVEGVIYLNKILIFLTQNEPRVTMSYSASSVTPVPNSYLIKLNVQYTIKSTGQVGNYTRTFERY